MRKGNHPQRRADARCRQPAGVAVGQQAAARLHQRAACQSNGFTELFIFFYQAQRFVHQRGNKILLPQGLLHAVEIVHQVHRRRARGAQRIQRHRQRIPVVTLFRQQRQ
ncbi:hypothetical protein D3C75_912740 [compost metagenome]